MWHEPQLPLKGVRLGVQQAVISAPVARWFRSPDNLRTFTHTGSLKATNAQSGGRKHPPLNDDEILCVWSFYGMFCCLVV